MTTTSVSDDVKAAQIIARSFWKMQNSSDATDADWDVAKAEFYRMAQQSVATLKERGYVVLRDAG